MIIFEINSVPYGSTGRIMFQIANIAKERGHIIYTSASFTKSRGEVFPENYYRIGSVFGKFLHIQLAYRTGWHGLYSKIATKRLVNKLKEVNPDIIHLHNLHGWYLNYPILTKYLKECGKQIIWTLHDCWLLTGQCPHFTAIGCNKWETECYECPLFKEYPQSRIDKSRELHKMKKEWFSKIPNMTIVTPSQWLKELVKKSYVRDYDVCVINNGIDLELYKPIKSNFRQKYNLENKFILLGVAFDWTIKKGINSFKYLADNLTEDYKIVLIGVSSKLKKNLPDNILTFECTQNQQQLVEIYSTADLFVNPTLEDNFPTVNLEALACGTPVITFETGGSPEVLTENCGRVISYGNNQELLNTIVKIRENRPFCSISCRKRAMEYGLSDKYEEYLQLFEEKGKARN